MTEFTTHYFRIASTGEEVVGPGPDPIYAVGDAVYLGGKNGWVRITRKLSIVHNAKRANVHWEVELTSKPENG
jgi:hypothetical protein